MKIIVTGSTGFVGKHLIPLLLKDNSVLELTRDVGKSASYFGDKTLKHQISEDQLSLRSVIKEFNPDICIHLAAFLTAEDNYGSLQKLLDSNITFLCRLLDALKESQLKLFINTGSFAEYYNGDEILNPAYLYAATKIASRAFIDYYAKAYNFKQVTIVPYTIYGGNDSQKKIIDIIYDSINSEKAAELSPGMQILDFIHIDDVVDFYLKIIKCYDQIVSKSNFQIGTGKGTTLRELAQLIEKEVGKKTNIIWGAKPYRSTDIMYAVAKLYEIDFWKPNINLEQGIKMHLIDKN